MLEKKVRGILKNREFISVATADLAGRPNAAPKFILKNEGDFIYLIDYTIGRTWQNLKINPHASLSLVDIDTLKGYQINGKVEIIEDGPEYDQILKELQTKEIDLSVKRIIEGVARGIKHETFEVEFSRRFVLLKVQVREIVEIGPQGELSREKTI